MQPNAFPCQNMTATPIFQTHDLLGGIDVRDVDGIRSLHFNSEPLQSAMVLSQPDHLLLAYAQAMMSWRLFADVDDDDLLLIGLGGGSLAKYMLQQLPHCRIEAVEYRQAVVDIAHTYFDLPRDDRLNVVVDDGARYVSARIELQQAFYRVILLDAFDATGMAPTLCNPAFFAHCKQLLKTDGILVVDLWNSTEQFMQLISWIGGLFDAKVLFLPVENVINVIGLFFNKETPLYSLKALKKRAIALEKTHHLPFKQFLKALVDSNPHFIKNVITA